MWFLGGDYYNTLKLCCYAIKSVFFLGEHEKVLGIFQGEYDYKTSLNVYVVVTVKVQTSKVNDYLIYIRIRNKTDFLYLVVTLL